MTAVVVPLRTTVRQVSGCAGLGVPRALVSLPGWLADPGAVSARIAAKSTDGRVDPFGAPFWRLLARVCQQAQLAVETPGPACRPYAAAARRQVTRGLASRLPWPPPAPPASPTGWDDDEPDPAELAADLIADVLPVLADAIDDPYWTDPVALAGWIDDLRAGLRELQHQPGSRPAATRGCPLDRTGPSHRPVPSDAA